MCGKLSINQSAFLLKNADMVYTNDTGLMHIAAALKKKGSRDLGINTS